jgi:hypothetical protein
MLGNGMALGRRQGSRHGHPQVDHGSVDDNRRAHGECSGSHPAKIVLPGSVRLSNPSGISLSQTRAWCSHPIASHLIIFG